MTSILLGPERFATFWTSKETNAMPHNNTVFHQVLNLLPWDEFDRLVDKYQADKGVRRLSTRSQLITMIYAQLSGAVSLREIEAGLQSHEARLYHLGATATKRSTLADANERRPAGLYAELFALIAGKVHRGLRRHVPDATYLIDSTSLRLDERSACWARFSAKVNGAKAHFIYDPDADCPTYFSITAGNVNDITAAQKMPIKQGATYVFDLGYYEYRWWAELDAADCRIVTRLKKNMRLEILKERPVPKGGAILSDRIGHLPERLTYSRRNPFENPVREICVITDTGVVLRIVTNDLDAPAKEIADLYKRRWAIELFFRWIKQTLRIRHLVGTSQNAVVIQVAIALIAFLLLRMAQKLQTAVAGPLSFARLIRANLMHCRRIDQLLTARLPRPIDTGQMELQWSRD